VEEPTADAAVIADRPFHGVALLAAKVDADDLFFWWHCLHDGVVDQEGFVRNADGIRRRVRAGLRVGMTCGCAPTAGTCREILKVEKALWTFVRRAGLAPTNNAAERALRHAVQWRKVSYGTDSPMGSHFVANILTVVASCRQQGRNVLHYLTACCQAHRLGTQPPSLISASTP